MGYSISGFAFGETPDLAKLEGELPELGLVLVKHRQLPLWLLAARPAGTDEPQYPFSDLTYFDGVVGSREGSLDAESLEQCVGATDGGYANGLVAAGIRVALKLNQVLRVQVLYFVANDDGVNFAALIDDGGVRAFRSSADFGAVEVEEGCIIVKPEFTYLDEEDKKLAAEIAEQFVPVSTLPNVSVHAMKLVRDGEGEDRLLHDSALKVWPSNWPDPVTTTGIGTWDAFAGYPTDFEIVLSR